jgi:1,4-alpha-glucan branching enzyme
LLRRRREMVKSQTTKVKTRKTGTAARKRSAKRPTAKKATSRPAAAEKRLRALGIKKEYLNNGDLCAVTFTLPNVAAPDATSVVVVGDFNDWNLRANPMEKVNTGDYVATLELKPGREYQFRYLIDESKWENDWNADKYVKNPYGDSDNSVVTV